MAANLTTLQHDVIGALKMDARTDDCTVEAIAERTGLFEGDVRRALDELEPLEPKLVRRVPGDKSKLEFWIALVPAADAFGEGRFDGSEARKDQDAGRLA